MYLKFYFVWSYIRKQIKSEHTSIAKLNNVRWLTSANGPNWVFFLEAIRVLAREHYIIYVMPAACNSNTMTKNGKEKHPIWYQLKIGSFSYWTNYALFLTYKLITCLHRNVFKRRMKKKRRSLRVNHVYSTRMMIRPQLKDINFQSEYTMILCLSLWLPCNYFIEIIFASNHLSSGYAHRANNNALETMARLHLTAHR